MGRIRSSPSSQTRNKRIHVCSRSSISLDSENNFPITISRMSLYLVMFQTKMLIRMVSNFANLAENYISLFYFTERITIIIAILKFQLTVAIVFKYIAVLQKINEFVKSNHQKFSVTVDSNILANRKIKKEDTKKFKFIMHQFK